MKWNEREGQLLLLLDVLDVLRGRAGLLVAGEVVVVLRDGHAVLHRAVDVRVLQRADLLGREVEQHLRAREQQVDLLERLALRLRAHASASARAEARGGQERERTSG